MRQGHFKVARKLFDGSDMLWEPDRPRTRLEAWLDLIQMAAWRNGTPYASPHHGVDVLARGEFVASLRYLGKRWKWDKMRVSRYFDLLEKARRLARQRDGEHGTVYLIVNYGSYQAGRDKGETGSETGAETEVRQRRDKEEAVKQLSSTANAPRTADAVGAGPVEVPPVAPPNPNAARKPKGEPAPWMGEVRRVWQEKYPGSEPKRGTAEALRPAVRAHTAEVVVPRLAKYLRETKANFINLNTFASTVMDPKWAPSGAALVGSVTDDTDPAVLAGRMYDVLERVDAIEIDARSTHMRLNNAVMAGAVPKEDAAAVWRVVKAGDLVISRRRETAVRFLEATLRSLAASEAAAPDLPVKAVA